jgi:hypothetical protein
MVAGGNDHDNDVSRLVETVTVLLEKLDNEDKTLAISGASMRMRDTVLNHLGITLSGAKWEAEPTDAALSDIRIDVYRWALEAEDADAQRKAYMVYLEKHLFIPPGYAVADCAKNSTLLNVEMDGKFKFRGTTDVVVAESRHVENNAVRNHIVVELELKTTKNNDMAKHEPQAVLEHLSSSWLNRDTGVLTILTDLNEKWVFYWFHPNGTEIMKCVTDRKRAQFLLDNMISNESKNGSTSDELPEHFWNRGVWSVVEKAFLKPIEEEEEDDDDEDGAGKKRRKRNRGPRKESSEAPHGKNDSNQGGDSASSGSTHDGSGHDKEQNCTLAQLFDYVGHDVGNEMDLLSMTDDEDERIRVVRRFLARHIVPGIVGGGISEVGIDCRTPPSDEIACPTLSESNVLRHNTASS